MKYQLETIPVWDGIQSSSECFVCALMEQAEQDAVNFYLGPSVMNPETRVQVNKTGFCPAHTAMLVKSGSPNAMAVLWESHFEETKNTLNPLLEELKHTKNLKKTLVKTNNLFANREKGCLICSRMETRLNRYCYTVSHLWASDQEFKTAFAQSKGFCLHHMQKILLLSLEALDSTNQRAFASAMAELQQQNLERVAHDLWYMTEHYKSENRDKAWNGCEDAQKRAVFKEIGKGRIQ